MTRYKEGFRATTQEESISVDCPKCKQPAGKKCVYMATGQTLAKPAPWASGKGLERRARVGTECKKTHNERASNFWKVNYPEKWAAMIAELESE